MKHDPDKPHRRSRAVLLLALGPAGSPGTGKLLFAGRRHARDGATSRCARPDGWLRG